MANYNRVMLMGNLTKDPELKYIQSGAAVCNLRMAINRKWRSKSGEDCSDVTYVSVVVWQKQAENAAKYLHKGSPLFVEGRLQSRDWETENKEKRQKLEVVADRVQFLSSGKKREAGQDPEEPFEGAKPKPGSNAEAVAEQLGDPPLDGESGEAPPPGKELESGGGEDDVPF